MSAEDVADGQIDCGDTGIGSTAVLLQSEWWCRVKCESGWTAASEDPLVLQRQIGPFSLAYAPHAFGVEEPRETAYRPELRHVVNTLVDIGKKAGATLVRWDVPWELDGFSSDEAHELGLRPSPMRVQPPDTVILPLGTETETSSAGKEALLAQMKPKTRYNIRLAGRKGVEVSSVTGGELLSALPAWYEMYRETARRDGITIHPPSYYNRVVQTAVEMGAAGTAAPTLTLYTARHDNDLLAGIITASWNGVTTYLYGASTNLKRNLMASYALQWEAMKDAVTAGDHSYDMFGIPPTDDPAHPMHGLYRFKTGFGGRIVHRAGAWDLPVRPIGTRAYHRVERLRKWYFFTLRKELGSFRIRRGDRS